MAFARQLIIGQTSTGSQIGQVETSGESLAKGDAADLRDEDGSASRFTGSLAHVGFQANIGPTRHFLTIKIPLKGNLPAFSRVFQAFLNLSIERGSFPSGVVPGGTVKVSLYGIRRPGFDYATFEWDVYKTSTAWAEFGGKIGVDYTALEIGLFNFSQTDYDTLGSSGKMFKAIECAAEIQYHTDRNEDGYVTAMPAAVGWRVAAVAREYVFVENPASFTTSPHHYLTIKYVPSLVLHSSLATSGRAIDLNGVLDKDSFESSKHIYLGFIDQGEIGDPVKYWIRNTRTDRVARRIILEATRSMATTPVANVANVGTKTLRSVDVYDLHQSAGVTDELTPRGAWYCIATSSTQYSVYFQADFTGSYTIVASGKAFGSDEIISVSSVKKIRLRSAKWSAATPTTNDRWDFETVGDTTDPNFSTDSKSMMDLIPPTSLFAGDSPDTSKSRPVTGKTQRLRGSTYNFDDSGTNRSVVMLADCETGYSVNQWGYIFDGTGYEAVQIHAIKQTADALPTGAPGGEVGDAVVTTTQLSRTYAAGAYFTTGLYIDSIAKASDTFVAVGGAAAGQNLINLTTAVDWSASDTVNAIHLDTGLVETYVIDANLGGLQIRVTSNLLSSLAAGDLVLKTVATNSASFFARGEVPEGASLGDRLAFLRVYEARSSLQNIV